MAIIIYTYNDKVVKDINTGKWFRKPQTPVDPYNPLGLPPNTVRVRTSDGNPPNRDEYTTYETATLVPGTNNVYDVYRSGTLFNDLLYKANNITEVLGANTTGITNTGSMFGKCTSLTTVSLFDTSSVIGMMYMFDGCSSLTSIPLFDTSSVGNIGSAFKNCYQVESGALALYQQVSTQTTPPSYYQGTFKDCGRDTVTGAAELAQIPSSWK